MHHGAVAALSLGLFAASQSGCMTAVAAFQAENLGGETIVITTIDAEGEPHERVLSPIDDDGRLFVAANHWPRAWYRRALANPDVRVTRKGETTDYTAVPVSEAEREHLLDDSGFPAVLYVFTGFAPRQFLRLDPRQASSPPLRRSDTRPACRRADPPQEWAGNRPESFDGSTGATVARPRSTSAAGRHHFDTSTGAAITARDAAPGP